MLFSPFCEYRRLPLEKVDLRQYAAKGAEQRLLEVAEEAAKIFAAFPELRARGRGFDAVGRGRAAGAPPARAQPTRRKRKMSAAARKRISQAQKKRWAKLKKAQGKK
jgi:hypothetical protein